MVKKIIKYIFIYTIGILLVGCDNPTSVESCDYCHLDIETNLPMDENGIYHLYKIDSWEEGTRLYQCSQEGDSYK